MKEYRLGALESRFADIVWENAPVKTPELVKLCEEEFNWKRTTTYTVLKRLSNGGLSSRSTLLPNCAATDFISAGIAA